MHRIATGLALAAGLIAGSVSAAPAQVFGGYNNLPPGSYQQSCINASMRGSTLSAACTANNGQRVYSSLNVSRCNGDIANSNGYLRCNGNNGGYNGGYYNGGNTGNGRDGDDNDNDNDGGHGHGHHHHHPNGNAYGYYNHGPGSQNGGYNGGGYNNGYGYGLPPGSYQQSCQNARMNGSMLSASCTAPNGQWIGSSIDVRQCQSRGTDIANRNGYLSC